jgi:lipoate-protein ligase A
MRGVAKKKVKGGKLIEVELDYNEFIEHAIISGDFFLHPEEGIEDLEGALVGLSSRSGLEEITFRLEEIISTRELILIGFTPQDLAETVLEALK